MQGIDSSEYGYQKGYITDCNLYDPKEDDFIFTIVNETNIENGDSQLYANFYDALFNQICINGWTENAQIDDQDYMAEMLKSGMVFISSISDDGYYYQGKYSTDKNILEVADEEAIAKAEAKYNTEKTKIENKEQTIDLKMKNLDTEISSLTTEYDTTKSLISKSIEKSIKRYEA
jgi:alpha-galactosidase/6-phospho-beta-glucosidase family protein